MEPTTIQFPDSVPSEADIQKLAYALYLESGCMPGRELDHWFAAKELLRHRQGRTGTRDPLHPLASAASQLAASCH